MTVEKANNTNLDILDPPKVKLDDPYIGHDQNLLYLKYAGNNKFKYQALDKEDQMMSPECYLNPSTCISTAHMQPLPFDYFFQHELGKLDFDYDEYHRRLKET